MIWRKSSFSDAENECIELAVAAGLIRDSKNPAGPRLAVPDLASFLAEVRRVAKSQQRFDQ